MRAGNLRHLVEVQRKNEVIGDYGEELLVYSTLFKAYAEIYTLRGSESYAKSGLNAVATHNITIRFRPLDFNVKDIVVYSNRTFDIISIDNVSGRNKTYRITVKERV